ncbi:MAG: SDR family oxidoreductase [Synergistaceae bacterium]|jgi:NAD(P)-dependent dehydrogenase (short-subunit alcohol dehydrogenase family)|nr:SDR family oxidoreductase [Synergistaceae bacterium]
MKDYWGYKGKKCAVTGSSSGMGRAAAEMLVDLGAEVYGLDITEREVPGMKFIKTDLSRKESIDAAFAELPEEIDRFFGVAGVSGMQTGYVATMTVNTVANRYITDKYLLLGRRMADNGAIVYCTSASGARWQRYMYEFSHLFLVSGTDFDGQVQALEAQREIYGGDLTGVMAYSVSKRATTYYAKLIMAQAAERGIRVNNIGPGFASTGLMEEFKNMVGGTEEAVASNVAYAINRVARPEELAAWLVMMNSEMATYCTGQYMFLAGGLETEIELYGRIDTVGFPMLPVREYI